MFVTYALRDFGIVPVPSDGSGLVNIFDLTGHLIKRFVSPGSTASAPWGIAQSSANFGQFSNAILLANAGGDQDIHAYDPNTGNELGGFTDGGGNALFFDSMRGLAFRTDGVGDPNTLYNVSGAAVGLQPTGDFDAMTPGSTSQLTLSLPTNPVPGTPLNVIVHITAPSGTPTGAIAFSDACCNPVTQLGTTNIANGMASVTATFTSGAHPIFATYAGDATFAPNRISEEIDVPFTTNTALLVQSVVSPGAPVTMSATVAADAGGAAISTGQVTFLDGSTSLGTAPVTNGAAQLTVNSLALGRHTIVASFTGSGLFLNSQSTPILVAVGNPVPGISSLSPFSAKQNSGALTLTVNGSNFVNGAVVSFNGSMRQTTVVSPTQLTAAITAADLATAGSATVTVANPGPGGGNSGMALFAVDTATRTSVTLGSPTLIVTAGQSVTVKAQLAGFTGAIAVACLNAPAGVTCAFDSASNTVTIQTAATTPKGSQVVTFVFTAQALASNVSSPALLATSLGVLGLPLGSVLMEVRRRRKFKTAHLIVLLTVLLLTIAGCGGYGSSHGMQPSPTPQPQSAQASASLTLTVQ